MLQARCRANLGEEPFAPERRTEIRMQHFDGNIAVVLDVVREVHRGHAASTEFAVKAVAVGKRCRESRDDVTHGV